MKQNLRHLASLLVASSIIVAGVAQADDEPASGKMEMKPEEMKKKMEAAGTPGAEHKALDALVGDWDAEVQLWMDPQAPPSVTKGSAKAAWIMDGRFVQEEFKGEFMGKPFRGMSLTGFDNTKKRYTTAWIDDMNTAMYTSEGTGSADRKTITLEGKSDCPLTGQKDVPMKQVLRMVDQNKHIFEMYDQRTGKDIKTMEITYTRK